MSQKPRAPLLAPLNFSEYYSIFILTGAGISAGSGLPTFRGPDGLLNQEAMWASDALNLPASLPALWKLYGGLRQKSLQVEPNAAHQAIAALQVRLASTHAITLATQNVDGLHTKAGSPDVAELHGSVMRSRCTNPACPGLPFEDHRLPDQPLLCARCGAPLRPDIVLFNEQLPADVLSVVFEALRDCDIFIAVGTSGAVVPAAEFVRWADEAGARTLLVNLHPMLPRNPHFHEEYLGKAEDLLPILFDLKTE